MTWRLGTTGQGGIAARQGGTDGLIGSDVSDASLLVHADNPYAATLQSWETTFIAFNLSSQAVASATLVICVYTWGLWLVIWEDCPSS